MRYGIELSGETHMVEVSLAGAGRYRVRIGESEAFTVEASVFAGLVHLHDGGRSFSATVGGEAERRDLHADGLQAQMEVMDARAARRKARRGGNGAAGGGVVKSPMPGRVVQVMVGEGETVTQGQGVVIVEAMKMENELRAERDGVVAKVHVGAGDLVEANTTLLELEEVSGE